MSPRKNSLSDIPLPASRRKIDLAGQRIRNYWADDSLESDVLDTDADLLNAALLMIAFRYGFQDPLGRVTMGLRSFVRTEGASVLVSQRLKRESTIAAKLVRM